MKITITNAVLQRFCAGDVTEAETDQIAEWLDADPTEHQKMLNKAHAIYMMGVICSSENTTHRSVLASAGMWSLRSVSRFVIGAAAALLIGFGVNYAIFSQRVDKWSQQMTSLEVPAGQHISLTLGDGSRVDLNSGTKIVYPSVFTGKERKVRVSGEAMFDVAHDPERPFIVETFAYNVEVLGTKFNVIANEEDARFSTALMRGKVRITNNSDACEQIVMTANSVVTLTDGRLLLSELGNPDEYLWPDGIISISGHPFDELMSRFETYYNVSIAIDRSTLPIVKYKRCKVRVSEGVEHALDILQLSADFTYDYNKDTNIITIQ